MLASTLSIWECHSQWEAPSTALAKYYTMVLYYTSSKESPSLLQNFTLIID